jgi:uncharacterized coiled-coil DUF342 family protein
MPEINIEVLKERIDVNIKEIDKLRKHTHDLTNGFFAMSETLKKVNQDVIALFDSSTVLNEKIEKFNRDLIEKVYSIESDNKEVIVRKKLISNIIKYYPKYLIHMLIFLSAIYFSVKESIKNIIRYLW